MRILGIETSCDETAVALLEYYSLSNSSYTPNIQTNILANNIYSQLNEHSAFGGVVPEIAARTHIALLDGLIKQAMHESKTSFNQIDLIAVTAGPGLVGGLIVGLMTAKALAIGLKKPFIGVNHLEGHALTPRLTNQIKFPYLLLLVSGGHTQILIVESLGRYHRIASTLDDALGEAFDKTAKLLGLPYPGGPYVEKKALSGDAYRFPLPRPLNQKNRLDFSFSGLKTAIRQTILAQEAKNNGALTEQDICDICASFQRAVLDILEKKISSALTYFQKLYPEIEHNFVIAGGVAANKKIRSLLENLCVDYHFNFYAPPQALCTDNAAMIAFAGAERFLNGEESRLDLAPRSRWPLDEKASPLLGTGKKGAKA